MTNQTHDPVEAEEFNRMLAKANWPDLEEEISEWNLAKDAWDAGKAFALRTQAEQSSAQVEPVDLVELAARADHSRAVYARALEQMRITLLEVRDCLEDEGDRIYLGSTNHADLLAAAWDEADALNWAEILAHTQPSTPLARVNLDLQAALTQSSEREAKKTAILEWYADQMCEGWCDNDPKACESIGAENCAGCPARQALGGSDEA